MKGIANPDLILVLAAAGVGVVLLTGIVRFIRRRKYYRDSMKEETKEALPDPGDDQEPEERDQTPE